ncbi:MAG: hypothetical protein UX85_C0001G0036 [Candidatus Beckwithbacteria bacterium GW2011_GWB1_47_15]|uniref:Uncharacterized protein n=1 Tax=Candidatus Beckwithbacteria bacterium GW2011_GWB1_47_15 TaxID=1618371 RepID=A0A0G1RXI2_9BACT|nr:MAG: hypothetical protein UY43_C0001G1093 [Candidatus Beckwithbacteria bacterium GW2011_GWC1_49_16]AQS30670.1 hypothetical protein [uncultured bacterium]KKU35858.1 MAG: hypothetical protein UX50_C0001G0035 [Candidatus Beckwithbacteria bacterium GW2011_GWA1_46_30]KKU61822.1 MAG: hypothetical protein UX85_C0001G0036 [Candidatus Beckwithbacteria bacterium GW2011_GWB1_47_15]KKU72624.1 MAG: hypothetical protein UX97_C0001G0494 [Candidatus Beckwithbacteria bacterium GW2011_GWA2_47_25]KKW04208.1 M
MLKLSRLHQIILSALATAILFLLALAILGISLFSANREQAGQIEEINFTAPEPEAGFETSAVQ